ncbi:TBC1 domain family member 12-like [Ornithodoros turicata]|uniref:TBC1 domain family member 12-like n=1 Tax=Ornithodoros turicata TaxID=34597 RepID=UPI00313A43F0
MEQQTPNSGVTKLQNAATSTLLYYYFGFRFLTVDARGGSVLELVKTACVCIVTKQGPNARLRLPTAAHNGGRWGPLPLHSGAPALQGRVQGSGPTLDGSLEALPLVYNASSRQILLRGGNGTASEETLQAPDTSSLASSLSSASTELSACPSDELDGPRGRTGLSGIFSKGLLSWKVKGGAGDSLPRGSSPVRSDGCCVPSSTTALILEQRPAHLPAKCPEEELRHRQQYEAMVKAARQKELKDAQARRKQEERRRQQEEEVANATRVWVAQVLPVWDTTHTTRRTRDLWWQGIPPSVRGRVWKLAIGNDLNITAELYEICASRSREIWRKGKTSDEGGPLARESSAHLIRLDVSRTFPQLGIFQECGPYFDVLHCILGAYVVYRPDVGYVQGMSFLAAMLLLNLDVVDAFVCFANLLNRPCQLAFFRVDQAQMKAYYALYDDFFQENLPQLFLHFKDQSLTSDLYLVDWIYTLYSRSLPLDVACRVWDVFLRDGEEFLFRSALGILRLYEEVLLGMDFIHLAQFLTKLPEDLGSEVLFEAIAAIHMCVNRKSFMQILAQHRDAIS